MKLAHFLLPAMATAALLACSQGSKALTVTVSNELDTPRTGETVELPADSILQLLGSPYCLVTTADGKEIPSQITHDGKLIFNADVEAVSTATYNILAADTMPLYTATVSGDIRPERADDISWENEKVGFRVYGPATQARGEKAFGYDIFFKHPTSELILDSLYAAQTSSTNWAKVDSLRKIDPKLASDFEKSFTYHLDHGLGMDCYAVGPTLGDGVAVLMEGDSLCFAWCYDKVKILDNGPIRFSVSLDFAPRVVGSDSAVVEHRVITLDSGSHLNEAKVWYDGLSSPRKVAAGFPRRDDAPALLNATEGIIAYSDPTQGTDNGRALLGVVIPEGADSAFEGQGHILATTVLEPSDTLQYNWGFAWSRTDIDTMYKWVQYLEQFAKTKRSPLKVSVQ